MAIEDFFKSDVGKGLALGIGAAILAGLGAGVFETPQEAFEHKYHF